MRNLSHIDSIYFKPFSRHNPTKKKILLLHLAAKFFSDISIWKKCRCPILKLGDSIFFDVFFNFRRFYLIFCGIFSLFAVFFTFFRRKNGEKARYIRDDLYCFYGENQGTRGKKRYKGESVISVSVITRFYCTFNVLHFTHLFIFTH